MPVKLTTAAKLRHKGRELHSADLLESSPHCPLCHADGARKALAQQQSEPAVHWLRCQRCQGVSVSRMPSQSVIEEIYQSYYVDDDAEKYTFHGIERLADNIVQHVRTTPSKSEFRILEVGGGDGTLIREIARRLQAVSDGLHVDGVEVELYQGGAAPSLPGVTVTHVSALDHVDGHFDLVIASAVLHQIPGAYEVLTGLFARVARGGIFFSTTAFLMPMFRLMGPLMDSLYPYHVHDMGCSFWNPVVTTFSLPAQVVCSRPSIVELELRNAPLRALLAHALKLPARVERLLPGAAHRDPVWQFVGGWEITLRFDA